MARKAAVGLFGLVMIGLIILAIVGLFHLFPQIQKYMTVKSSAEVYVLMNDEAGKVFPFLASRTGGISNMEFFSCRISGASGCGERDVELSALAKEMDTRVVLYNASGEFAGYGEIEDGEMFLTEVPLPGGKSGTVGFVLAIPSVQPIVSDWIWPLDSGEGITVRHCYGEKRVSQTSGRPYTHSGIDLGGQVGDRIYAVSDGTIKYVCSGATEGDLKGCHGYGNNLLIKHGDYYVRYSHMSRIAVGMEENRVVKNGEVIGYMGNTGYSFGSHLDFKVYSYDPGEWGYNANIDPLCMYGESYLNGVVRLVRAENDEDCGKARSVCRTVSAESYVPSENDE